MFEIILINNWDKNDGKLYAILIQLCSFPWIEFALLRSEDCIESFFFFSNKNLRNLLC